MITKTHLNHVIIPYSCALILLILSSGCTQSPTSVSVEPTSTATMTMTVPPPTPSPTSTDRPTQTPTQTPTATSTHTPTPTATPTLNLAHCTVDGCDLKVTPQPLPAESFNMLLNRDTPQRRKDCLTCVPNETFNEAALDKLIQADSQTMNRLRQIVLSQQAYEITPGVVYIMADEAHHIIIDLEENSYVLRNIIPPINTPEEREELRITPSYCFNDKSLVVITADYHGLNGSNKTETGRDIFFHLGRAALFEKRGRFDINVLREPEKFAETTVSWGGGPIFIWNGQFNYNPQNEWFTPEALEHYATTTWAKNTVALSQDRKYLFLTLSYGKTLAEHAATLIELGRRWGIKIDRAMRFDGSESAYLALRVGDYLVPVINLEEPIIVNCLAVENNE